MARRSRIASALACSRHVRPTGRIQRIRSSALVRPAANTLAWPVAARNPGTRLEPGGSGRRKGSGAGIVARRRRLGDMIVYRHADPRFPFLWESSTQPPGRWHARDEGPVHYFAETPDAAWAEFLRHEEIKDPADVEGIARSLWAIDLPRPPRTRPRLDSSILLGGLSSYPACQEEARRRRRTGARGLVAVCAAVKSTPGSGFRTEGGLRRGPRRPERVFVLFGRRPDLIGWAACQVGRPRADLLERVRPLS